MIIFPDPGLRFSINIPGPSSQVPKTLLDLVSSWKTWGSGNQWKETHEALAGSLTESCKSGPRITLHRCDNPVFVVSVHKDTTPKNLFLTDPPEDKMFSMPPPKIITLSQMSLLIGWLASGCDCTSLSRVCNQDTTVFLISENPDKDNCVKGGLNYVKTPLWCCDSGKKKNQWIYLLPLG